MSEQVEAIRTLAEGSGVEISFKRNEPWLFICDWILDPYHGRVYRIVERR
jgi:hypothetical protein